MPISFSSIGKHPAINPVLIVSDFAVELSHVQTVSRFRTTFWLAVTDFTTRLLSFSIAGISGSLDKSFTQRNGRDHRSFWSPAANAEMSTEYGWILVDLIEFRQQDTSKCSFLGALAAWVKISLSTRCISSMRIIFEKGAHRSTEAGIHRDGSCSSEFHISWLPESFLERVRVVEGEDGFLSKKRGFRRFQTLSFLRFDETGSKATEFTKPTKPTKSTKFTKSRKQPRLWL